MSDRNASRKKTGKVSRRNSLEKYQGLNLNNRIHIPVALHCNMHCNFCDHKYFCVNETQTRVAVKTLSSGDVLNHLKELTRNVSDDICVADIAGPGDPFANPTETMETIRLIRKQFPDIVISLSTNGLNVMPYVDELKRLKISCITITVNAVESTIGSKIYDWIRLGNNIYRGTKAAELLWDFQQLAIQALNFREIIVRINSLYIPGINSSHIEEIVKSVASLGASVYNITPFIPAKSTVFADLHEPMESEIIAARELSKHYLPRIDQNLLRKARCSDKNEIKLLSSSAETNKS